jgi:hypothetical protein
MRTEDSNEASKLTEQVNFVEVVTALLSRT